MRDYGKVHTSFWTSSTIRGLSEDARTLAIYLLTSPHSNIIGAFRLPDGYACDDLQWEAGRVREGFAELFRKGFATRCEATKWVWLCNFLAWNEPENPNQWKAARKAAGHIPAQCSWRIEFAREFARRAGDPEPEEGNPSQTVPQGFRNQEQEQEQKQEQEQDSEAPRRRAIRHTVPHGTERAGEPDRERRELMAKIQAVYPRGLYTPAAWIPAERSIIGLLEQGETPEALLAAAEAYRKQQSAIGKVGSQYIRSPATFYGEGHWRSEFELPADPKADALKAWDQVIAYVRSGERGPTPGGRVDELVRQVGGYRVIGATDNSRNPAYRNRFVQLWTGREVTA